ncbi:MAG: 2,3-bisphosphoglycerate-independent phosphoglycerate mutase [Actinomycetota bacterium]
MHRLLYVCLDGLGDDPVPALGDRTPLEAAPTPHLDSLAERGVTGTVVTVGEGIAPESDIAVFAILGYDPREDHPGRGVVEAIGAGMRFRDGDLAYRINFATVDWPKIIDRRVGRDLSSEDARLLAEEVNKKLHLPGATFQLNATVDHRGVLVIRSVEGPLSAAVTNTDPAYSRDGSMGVAVEHYENEVVSAEPLEDTEAARRSALLTNAFVEESSWIMDHSSVNEDRRREGRLPGNLILTRDAGDHIPDLQPIKERTGLSWGCFVEMPVERGIAIILGMEPVEAPRLIADEQYATWATLAADALGGFDALYVHLKGPDVPAHDGRAEDKRDVIATIDEAFFGELLGKIDLEETIVAVTADHSTSCIRAAHTADPVPLVVAGSGIGSDGSAAFGERAAAEGSIGRLLGIEIVPRLIELMRA